MDKKTPITIGSLPEFISEIMKYKNRSFSFRGERGTHEKRMATAFRAERVEWCSDSAIGYSDFMSAVNEFYSSVGHRLSDMEKEEFIPFAQHHRIPTNLLDVTSSPLIALFMACYKEKCKVCEKREDYKEENGYVYVFYNNYFIDITDVVQYQSWDIYNLFYLGNRDAINKLNLLFQEYLDNLHIVKPERQFEIMLSLLAVANSCYKKQETLEEAAYEIYEKVGEDTTALFDEMKAFRDIILSQPEMKVFPLDLFDGSDGDSSQLNKIGCLYAILLFYCCRAKSCNSFAKFFPGMIYRPKITFDRARGQQGYFVYQGYFQLGAISDVQDIEYEHVFMIENTERILEELDGIGMNYGTVYGDYDSIALHIKEKHERKLREENKR